MQYEQPSDIGQALTLLAQDDWTVLAGGTDFYPTLSGRPPKGNILDISALVSLGTIENQNDHWRIGALATWSDLIAAEMPPAFDGLKLAAREIGSIQIQNKATIVGNICNASPAADGVPPLLTLDARVEIISGTETRQLGLHEFIRGNRDTALKRDEMVSAILIPAKSTIGASSFTKLGARKFLVISIAMVAVRLAIDDQRKITAAAVSVGACSAVALRLPELESVLTGVDISEDIGALVQTAHLRKLTPLDDMRAPADYRLEAATELVRRTINAARERQQ